MCSFELDPSPTDSNINARHDMMMRAFGGKGYHAVTPEDLNQACMEAFASRKPALIDVAIDPYDGNVRYMI
jgi:oxalyl-CoA decarboxylase